MTRLPLLHPRRPFIWIGALAIAVGGYFLLREPAPKLPPPPNPWMGPVPVSVLAVTEGDLDVQLKSLGNVTPLNQVLVKSRVQGPITAVHFTEGQLVKAGDRLFDIDPAPYEVRLSQAEANLRETQAQLTNAEQDLTLYQTLYRQNNVPKQQLDKQVALAEQLRATLSAQKASVKDATLQLSYTRITAPIAGRVGLRKVDVGNLINANDAAGLVSITQVDPIAVTFTVPEHQLIDLRRAWRAAHEAGGKLAVDAWDRGEKTRLATGALTTLDNQIDPQTGTLKVKAEFANTDEVLFPNQFVNVRLTLAELDGQIVIPTDAVHHGADNSYVYLIENGRAKIQPIVLGLTQGNRAAIDSGLSAGDTLVMEGYDQLRNGREVRMLNPEAAGPRAAAAEKSDAAEKPKPAP